MAKGCIYIIKNVVNDLVYIGQTKQDVKLRFSIHFKPSVCSRNYKLQKAIKELGKDKFYYEVLENEIDDEKLNEKEIEYIAKYNSFENGYNSTPGGRGNYIYKQEDILDILEMARSGVLTKTIADKYGVCVGTIFRVLGKYSFSRKTDVCGMQKLFKTEQSNEEIAKKLGVSTATVSRARKKFNCRLHSKSFQLRQDINFDDIANDYYNQMPIDNICEKYNISKSVFYRIKNHYYFKTRPQIYAHKIRYYD